MKLPCDEFIDIDIKNIGQHSTGGTVPFGLYEISDLYLMLKSSHPVDVKVNDAIVDIRRRSN